MLEPLNPKWEMLLVCACSCPGLLEGMSLGASLSKRLPGLGPGEGGCEQPPQALPLCPQARTYIQSLPPMPQKDLRSIFRGANPLGEDVPWVWAGLHVWPWMPN